MKRKKIFPKKILTWNFFFFFLDWSSKICNTCIDNGGQIIFGIHWSEVIQYGCTQLNLFIVSFFSQKAPNENQGETLLWRTRRFEKAKTREKTSSQSFWLQYGKIFIVEKFCFSNLIQKSIFGETWWGEKLGKDIFVWLLSSMKDRGLFCPNWHFFERLECFGLTWKELFVIERLRIMLITILQKYWKVWIYLRRDRKVQSEFEFFFTVSEALLGEVGKSFWPFIAVGVFKNNSILKFNNEIKEKQLFCT